MRNTKVFMVIVLMCTTIICFAQNDRIVGYSIDNNPLIKLDSLGRPDTSLPMLFFASVGIKNVDGVTSGKICFGIDSTQIESVLIVPFVIENIKGQLVVKNGNYIELVKETPPEIYVNLSVKYAVKHQFTVPFEMLEEKNLQWRCSRLYLYDNNGAVLGMYSIEKS